MINPSPGFLVNFIPGTRWEKFDGSYRKDFCDVRMVDGTEIGPCWPNDGKFDSLNGRDRHPDARLITHVRYYADNPEGVEP